MVITPESLNEHYKQRCRCMLDCELRQAAEDGFKEAFVSKHMIPEFLAVELKAAGFQLTNADEESINIKWN